MTRKRFKKLCMGCGFSRSMADNAAFTTWFCFGNYAEGWRMMEEALAAVKRAAEGVKRAGDREGRPYGEEVQPCE